MVFSTFFPEFLSYLSSYYRLIFLGHPLVIYRHISGHFRHSLDYFRDINDSLIILISLEAYGHRLIIRPQNPEPLSDIIGELSEPNAAIC